MHYIEILKAFINDNFDIFAQNIDCGYTLYNRLTEFIRGFTTHEIYM